MSTSRRGECKVSSMARFRSASGRFVLSLETSETQSIQTGANVPRETDTIRCSVDAGLDKRKNRAILR
jgi:molybdopterin biosynthesis enzyme